MPATPVQFTDRLRPMARTHRAREMPPAAVAMRSGSDPAILSRIVAPVLIALTVIAALTTAPGATSLVILVAAFLALDVAALTFGHDSRDGLDWRPGQVQRLLRP